MKNKDETKMSSGVLQQYAQMKAKHPDAISLFRVGDFYELYREDAQKAKDILNLNVAKRNVDGKQVETAGFPHHALDNYLPKLVRAGQRVAICEQLEDPKLKKKEDKDVKATEVITPNNHNRENMPRQKKEKTPEQEQPKAKAEAKTEQKSESLQERKPREPQMITANGYKVTHGHAFQGKDTQDWYFTAKLNGEQLKPQKMEPADLTAYQKKEITVPQLMERYYPTKLMEKVPEVAFKTPNVITGPDGNMTIDKFNVYKEKDETKEDYGKYKFYAKIGDKQMSTIPSRQDLNAYFDRVMTPGQLVEKNFGERLHLSSHYQQFKLPEGIEKEQVRIAKDRSDGKWKVSVDLGERGKTEKKEISFDDGFSLYKSKTATREQIAAKYVGNEVKSLLAGASMKMEKSPSLKM